LIQLKTGLARWTGSAWTVLLAGVLHGLSFAPSHAWWLQIMALACLAAAASTVQARRAAYLGAVFGVGWLVSGFWWLYISMHQFGGLPAWMAAAAVVLLAAALSLYYALALALWVRLRPPSDHAWGLGLQALTWSSCWLLAELARATFLTGFPWIASGYAHTTGPLAAFAPHVGVYGLCALAAACAFALGAWWRVDVKRAQATTLSLAMVGLLALGALLPKNFTQSTGVLSVSLLQPNVSQDLKFDLARMQSNLNALIEQLHSAKGQLVVTPESVVPLSREDLGDAAWGQMTAPFLGTGKQRGALLGIFLRDDEGGYVNSLVGVSATGEAYQYGKRHLLPFGEVIPPGFGWFVRMMNIPLADQARGRNTEAFELAGQRIRPLICFEDLFGEDFVSSMVGPKSATVLANASNLAWFGRLLVQDQHLQFSQMRALEFQRPVVRSTNTGATAVVNHLGEVAARFPAWEFGTLESQVQGRTGETPYALWLSAWGLWPLWAWALAGLFTAQALSRRRRRA
jgi:apolipoprotein N-acyltransferase